jgi:hypothetical protein
MCQDPFWELGLQNKYKTDENVTLHGCYIWGERVEESREDEE